MDYLAGNVQLVIAIFENIFLPFITSFNTVNGKDGCNEQVN